MEVKLQLFPKNSRLVIGIENKFYLSLWEKELDLEPLLTLIVEDTILKTTIRNQEFVYKITNSKERKLVLSLKDSKLKVKIDDEKIFSDENQSYLTKVTLAKVSPNSKVLELSKIREKDLLNHNSDKKWITLLILISALTVVVVGTTILICVKVGKKKKLESIEL